MKVLRSAESPPPGRCGKVSRCASQCLARWRFIKDLSCFEIVRLTRKTPACSLSSFCWVALRPEWHAIASPLPRRDPTKPPTYHLSSKKLHLTWFGFLLAGLRLSAIH